MDMFRKSLFKLLTASVLMLCVQDSTARGADIEKYWANYATYEKELLKKYLDNKRIRTRTLDYSHKNWNEQSAGETDTTIIGSRNAIRVELSTKLVGKEDRIVRAMMFDADEMYYLEQFDTKYTIKGHQYDTENRFEILKILSRYDYAAPLSFRGWMDLRRQFQQYDDPRFAALKPTPKTIEEAILDGKAVLKLIVRSADNQLSAAYYDPANSGALLRHETSHTFDIDAMKTVNIKEIGTIEYVDSPLGYPVPKWHRCWYEKPDGTKIKHFDVEYLSYENYTPKSDDFDLEKQYGIKPLARPASAGPAPEGKSIFASTGSGIGRYLWIAGGVLAAITAILGILVWRKRRKAWARE